MIATPEPVLSLAVLLLGAPVGSFAAVLADRLPRGESVVAPRSRCRACGTPLALVDLVPIFSWVRLKGRCRHCGGLIPAWLVQAEAIGLLMGVGAVLVATDAFQMLLGAAFLWCLLALALSDLRRYRLPNELTATLFSIGLAMAVMGNGGHGPDWLDRFAQALLGALIGAGSFAALGITWRHITGREGLGAGDVKLMAGIGAALGPGALPAVTLLAGVSGLALTVLRALVRRRQLRPGLRLPFGAFLAMAAAAVWLISSSIATLPPM